jgi:poly-beta-1,6 N-acetyl-D-glucosamine synthase
MSSFQQDLEVHGTERLIESTLGIKTVLFRAPFSDDKEPTSISQIKTLAHISDLGYIQVGMNADPKDWRNPGVQEIVNRVTTQIEHHNGGIILLHDGGAIRAQTVHALPEIIQQLQKKGYTFVTAQEFLGSSVGLLNYPITAKEKMLTFTDGLGFVTLEGILNLINVVFALTIVCGIIRFFLIAVLAYIANHKKKVKIGAFTYKPSVAVIVPSYNEEKVITKTIKSLLESTYHKLEIIVVDDGSSDKTYEIAKQKYGHNHRVKIFTKENAGKSTAINFGVAHTTAEIIIVIDADTIIEKNAIDILVKDFAHPEVGAIAGNARVGNRMNFITKMQAFEYITSQNLDRRAFGILNCIRVVPGAIGAWRKSLIVQQGGFHDDTLAEDTDLTLRILRAGYKVLYEEKAIAYTEAPHTIAGLLKQRFRWMFGTLQAVWKQIDTLFRIKHKGLGSFAIPDVLLFQVLFPLFAPLMDLLMLLSFVVTFWEIYNHPTSYTIDNLQRSLIYYLLFLAVDYATAILAFLLEKEEDWKLLYVLFFQKLFYRQLMYFTAIKSTITAIRGNMVGWGKLERSATVSQRLVTE